MFHGFAAIKRSGKLPQPSYNENLTGSVYLTFTGWPFRLPGIHFGIFCNTLIASASVPQPRRFITLHLLMAPLSSTIKEITDMPSTLFSTASFGYLIFFARKAIIAGKPPGYFGCSSPGNNSVVSDKTTVCGFG